MSSPQSSPPLQLRLLGQLEVRRKQLALERQHYAKILALLAYLAVEAGVSHRREHLAELLWPELPSGTARTNLRQALYALRRSCGEAYFHSSRDHITFRADSPHWLDVRAFLEKKQDCRDCAGQRATFCASCLASAERRIQLYRGQFLSSQAVDTPAFDDWRAAQREFLHREALALLEQLRRAREERGEPEGALLHARRYTELEPWDEEAQRQLMRLLAENGQRGAALAQYEACRGVLSRELGLEPDAQTQALAESIRGRIGTEAAPAAVESTAGAGERRQAAILYCDFQSPDGDEPDVVAEQLEEQRREWARQLRSLGAHVVYGHDGTLLAYFGYPRALEDCAKRAITAGLALIRQPSASLQVHAAVHTGTIVTGGESQLPDGAGVTTRRARDLLARAGAGQLLVSRETRELAAGYFRFDPVETPDGGFRVRGPSHANSRLEAAGRLSPLAGRQRELTRLRESWKTARPGRRQILLIRGEAGIGKSRLIWALREGLAPDACVVRELHCYPEFQHSPLHPVVSLFEELLQLKPEDPPAQRFHKLRDYLRQHHPDHAESGLSPMARLLDAAPGDQATEDDLSPEAGKDATFAILLTLLDDLARKPLLLVGEDFHWADPTTLELFARFAARARPQPMLVLLSAREAFQPDWIEPGQIMNLEALDDADMRRLVSGASPGMDAATVGDIVRRADGVPLFAEEMAHHHQPQVPPSLQALLMGRLDACGEARRSAQLAATLGREFDRELLARSQGRDLAELDEHLRILEAARLLAPPDATGRLFRFRHALIQEAAYQSQTRADRREAHRRLAETIGADYPELAEQRPEQLARHFSEGGDFARALPRWLAAGRRALRACANAEAVDHLEQGLAVLDGLPEAQRDPDVSLDLLLARGQALASLQGYGSAEAAASYDRAFDHCAHLNPGARRFEVLWGLWLVSSSRPDSSFAESRTLVTQLIKNAEAAGDRGLLCYAHAAGANVALWQGRLEAVCYHAERAVDCGDSLPESALLHSFDPRAAALGHCAWARLLQGHLEEGLADSQRSLALAEELEHPDTLGFSLIHAAMVARILGDIDATRRYAQRAQTIAARHDLAVWAGAAHMLLGWSRAAQGDESGLQQLRDAAENMRQVMPSVRVAFLHALAEALGQFGHFPQQLETLDEALETADAADEHFHEAELYRLRGQCLWQLEDDRGARDALDRALHTAQQQGAQLVALRTALVLPDTRTLSTVVEQWEGDSRHPEWLAARRRLPG